MQSAKGPVIASKMIGEAVIIRTYSAGVWFGTLAEKEGNEVYSFRCPSYVVLESPAVY